MAVGESWSALENEVIVSAYLDMLDRELRGEPFVKSKVNEDVRIKIGRSRGSVEYKWLITDEGVALVGASVAG